MALAAVKRACRHSVSWPAKLRSVSETSWHEGQVVNLSVTGVLLRLDRRYPVGEPVEVEIEFLTQPDCKIVVSGMGHIVREDHRLPGAAAVQFQLECSLAPRRSTADGRRAARGAAV